MRTFAGSHELFRSSAIYEDTVRKAYLDYDTHLSKSGSHAVDLNRIVAIEAEEGNLTTFRCEGVVVFQHRHLRLSTMVGLLGLGWLDTEVSTDFALYTG